MKITEERLVSKEEAGVVELRCAGCQWQVTNSWLSIPYHNRFVNGTDQVREFAGCPKCGDILYSIFTSTYGTITKPAVK